MRAAIYTRISRLGDPDDPRRAVKRQEESCRELCSSKEWQVIEVYTDEDRSASKDNVVREDYDRLRRDAADDMFDVVVVWKLDRIGRRTREVLTFVEELEDHDVKFVSVNDAGIDTSGPTGRLVTTVMAGIAQFEAEQMGLRIAAERHAAAEEGRPSPGGRRAFGYAKDGVTIFEEEAELIREAADRYLSGEGLQTIAKDWADRGVKTPSGSEWRAGHISRFLRSDRVYGRRVHKKQVYDATWDAILDRSMQSEIIERRERGDRREIRPLTGILRCGLCGQGLNFHSGRTAGDRYRCVTGPALPGCGGVSVKADLVEDALWHEALGRTWHRDRLSEDAIRTRLDTAIVERKARRGKLDELDDAYFQRDEYDRRTYRRQSDALRDQLETLNVEITQLSDQLATTTGELLSALKMVEHHRDATTAERRAVLSRALRKVVVAKAKPGKWFNPERLTIYWVDTDEPQKGSDLRPEAWEGHKTVAYKGASTLTSS